MKFLSLPAVLVAALLMVAAPSFAQSGTVTVTVRPNPLDVQVAAPENVVVGQWFEIEVAVFNKGAQSITKTSAKIHTPSELKVRGKKKRIGTLPAGQTKIIWQAKANNSGDNLIIQVDVEGFLDGEKITAGDTAMVSATGSILLFLFRLLFTQF